MNTNNTDKPMELRVTFNGFLEYKGRILAKVSEGRAEELEQAIQATREETVKEVREKVIGEFELPNNRFKIHDLKQALYYRDGLREEQLVLLDSLTNKSEKR